MNVLSNRESLSDTASPRSVKPGLSWAGSYASRSKWVVGGLMLLGLHALLAWISGEFEYSRPLMEKPVLTLVAVQLMAGAIFMVVVFRTEFAFRESKNILPWLLGIGIALRAVTMCSTPMLETDFYRYMWDGAVLANGMNPYQYAPDQAEKTADPSFPNLAKLAKESGDVVHRINHQHLRTIYPPVAQAFFALAYFINPWSLFAWRVVLVVFDAAVLLLLLLVLRNLRLSYTLATIYWWNPLVIREVFNAGHMDVMALPLVMLAVMLAAGNRSNAAAIVLAGAVGVKLWPVVLLPVVLSPLRSHPRRLLLPTGLFGAVSALMFLPIYLSGLDQNSGFAAYGKSWQMNDALYMLLLWAVELIGRVFAWDEGAMQVGTRAIVAAAVMVWTVWLCMDGPQRSIDLWERSLLVISAVFLLSPTQFPWYYIWMAPLVATRPRVSLLLLSVLLSLYYLRFYFKARDSVAIFDYYIVWLEYIPVWLLLLREWLEARTMNTVWRPGG